MTTCFFFSFLNLFSNVLHLKKKKKSLEIYANWSQKTETFKFQVLHKAEIQ